MNDAPSPRVPGRVCMHRRLVIGLSCVSVLLATIVPSARADEAQLALLSWLPGCWSTEQAEPGSGEQWLPLAGASLLGVSRTVRGGQTVGFEFMRIASGADGRVAFFAQPSGKPPASFALLRITEREVVFENLEHDFPQRVIYRFEPPTHLHASIEGQRAGSLRRIAYPMVRTSCDALVARPPGR